MKKWNKGSIRKEALRFSTLREWETRSTQSFKFAKENNWVSQVSKHIKPRFRWTHDSVKEKAKEYRTKRDWSRYCLGSYGYAVRYGILNNI